MLIQRAGTGTLPPPGFTVPPWEDLKHQWSSIPTPSTETVVVGPASVILGHQDSEADDERPEFVEDVQGHNFGWDNESPERHVTVDAFKAEWRPVSNHEFQQFWLGEGKRLGVQMPKSWVIAEDEDIKVCVLFLFFLFYFQNWLTYVKSPRSEHCMVMSRWRSQHTGLFSLHTTTLCFTQFLRAVVYRLSRSYVCF